MSSRSLCRTLRDRLQDIPDLVKHFLGHRQIGSKPFQLAPGVLETFARYEWPGNVRELANVLERAQILAENQTITLDDLPESMNSTATLQHGTPSQADPRLLREVERRHVQETMRCKRKAIRCTRPRCWASAGVRLYRLLQKYQIKDNGE